MYSSSSLCFCLSWPISPSRRCTVHWSSSLVSLFETSTMFCSSIMDFSFIIWFCSFTVSWRALFLIDHVRDNCCSYAFYSGFHSSVYCIRDLTISAKTGVMLSLIGGYLNDCSIISWIEIGIDWGFLCSASVFFFLQRPAFWKYLHTLPGFSKVFLVLKGDPFHFDPVSEK